MSTIMQLIKVIFVQGIFWFQDICSIESKCDIKTAKFPWHSSFTWVSTVLLKTSQYLIKGPRTTSLDDPIW